MFYILILSNIFIYPKIYNIWNFFALNRIKTMSKLFLFDFFIFLYT